MIGEYVKLSGGMELIAKLKADERLMKNKDAKEGIEEMALLLQVSLHFIAVFLVARTQLYKSVGHYPSVGGYFWQTENEQQLNGRGPVSGQRPDGEQLMVVYTNLFLEYQPSEIFLAKSEDLRLNVQNVHLRYVYVCDDRSLCVFLKMVIND